MNASIIAFVNQKGGVSKTTSCLSVGVGLARMGKKVLLVDMDPQASLTISLGITHPDQLPVTITNILYKTMLEEPVLARDGIIHHEEGIDLMPADIQLSGMEMTLVNAIGRERVLGQYLNNLRTDYTHILIDCQPSLGMLTVNALAAADRIIIPVQAEYLPAKGLEQLLNTVNRVRKQINPELKIDGILLAMLDRRTLCSREIADLVRNTYGDRIPVFATEIPFSVRAKEASSRGISIYQYDPNGKVADAYSKLTREVCTHEKNCKQDRSYVR